MVGEQVNRFALDGIDNTNKVWTLQSPQGWIQHAASVPVNLVNGDQFGALGVGNRTIRSISEWCPVGYLRRNELAVRCRWWQYRSLYAQCEQYVPRRF